MKLSSIYPGENAKRVFTKKRKDITVVNSNLTGLTTANILASTTPVLFVKFSKLKVSSLSSLEIYGKIHGLGDNNDWNQWYIVKVNNTGSVVSKIISRGTWNAIQTHNCSYHGLDQGQDVGEHYYQLRLCRTSYNFKLNGCSNFLILGGDATTSNFETDMVIREVAITSNLEDTTTGTTTPTLL